MCYVVCNVTSPTAPCDQLHVTRRQPTCIYRLISTYLTLNYCRRPSYQSLHFTATETGVTAKMMATDDQKQSKRTLSGVMSTVDDPTESSVSKKTQDRSRSCYCERRVDGFTSYCVQTAIACTLTGVVFISAV